jgi:hypothetical protein
MPCITNNIEGLLKLHSKLSGVSPKMSLFLAKTNPRLKRTVTHKVDVVYDAFSKCSDSLSRLQSLIDKERNLVYPQLIANYEHDIWHPTTTVHLVKKNRKPRVHQILQKMEDRGVTTARQLASKMSYLDKTGLPKFNVPFNFNTAIFTKPKIHISSVSKGIEPVPIHHPYLQKRAYNDFKSEYDIQCEKYEIMIGDLGPRSPQSRIDRAAAYKASIDKQYETAMIANNCHRPFPTVTSEDDPWHKLETYTLERCRYPPEYSQESQENDDFVNHYGISDFDLLQREGVEMNPGPVRKPRQKLRKRKATQKRPQNRKRSSYPRIASTKPMRLTVKWADPPTVRFATTTVSSYAYNMNSLNTLVNGGSSTQVDYIDANFTDAGKYKKYRVDFDQSTFRAINNENLSCTMCIFPSDSVVVVSTSTEFAIAMGLGNSHVFTLGPASGVNISTRNFRQAPARLVAPGQYNTQDDYTGAMLNGVPNGNPTVMLYWIVAVSYTTISTTLGVTCSLLSKRKVTFSEVDVSDAITIHRKIKGVDEIHFSSVPPVPIVEDEEMLVDRLTLLESQLKRLTVR